MFGRREVLTGASLWAEAGKITTLLGQNGSGKTTLLRIAAGLLRPDQGVVMLQGTVIHRPRLAKLARRGVVFLPQGRLIVRGYSIRDHLAAVTNVVGRAGVEAAIEHTNLAQLLDRQSRTLSGGEKGRVSLALALALQPSVLIADEPLVGLDPIDQQRLANILQTIASEGVAVVTSGHDTRVLLEVSDAVIWSVAGSTHHLGSPAESAQHEQFRREYLGPGFTMPT